MRFLAVIEMDGHGLPAKYSVGSAFEEWLSKQEFIAQGYGGPIVLRPRCAQIVYEDLDMMVYDMRQAADLLDKAIGKTARTKAGEKTSKPKTTKRKP